MSRVDALICAETSRFLSRPPPAEGLQPMSRQSAPALPVSHVILPGLEEVTGYWGVGVSVTLMLTVGIANGFNLIDGMNGLAAIAALVAATSLSVISDTAGLPGLSPINLILAAALIEFLALNVPAGRIFG
jgi:UDP-GlcNAc:undecaprenyl-phosphate/decaprenyl-phosphate GlcNAc-1-phosphate transferase